MCIGSLPYIINEFITGAKNTYVPSCGRRPLLHFELYIVLANAENVYIMLIKSMRLIVLFSRYAASYQGLHSLLTECSI